jgi:hypothetical protein
MVPIPLSVLRVAGFFLGLYASSTFAAETIEAIGGERCGKPQKPYAVEFLAPEDADIEASAKGMAGGSEDVDHAPPALSLDGKPCPNGRCAFHAAKGQTYKLVAKTTGPRFDRLCISITRP